MRNNKCKSNFFSAKQFFVCVMLLVSVSSIFSYSGPDEDLTIIIETEPLIPFVNLEWKITLLVDYPYAANVFAAASQFPEDYLQLDRVRTEPYLMHRGNAMSETWTRVEFFFIPLKPGRITIPPFEIKTPEKNALTPLMVFQIEAPYGSYQYQPELRWESVPDFLVQGRSSELLLVMQNHDPEKNPEDSLPASIDIPQNAVMERLPLRLEDREKNAVLRVNIIPLQEGNLSIDPVVVQYEGTQLASPSLHINVVSDSLHNAQSVSAYSLPKEELNYDLPDENIVSHEQDEDSSLYIRFLPAPLKNQYDTIVTHTDRLWNNDEKIAALAFLRKAERDETIGFLLRPFRKNLEEELGLGITNDELYLPVNFFLVLSAVFFAAIIILFLFLFLSKKKQSLFSFFRIVCYVLLVICIIAVLIFGGAGMIRGFGTRTSNQAVVYKSDAYRVPEITSAISGSFEDGENAFIRAEAGAWFFLETENGKSGWVPEDKVIRY